MKRDLRIGAAAARRPHKPKVDGSNPSSATKPLVGLCRAAGLSEPVTEHRFHPLRRWRFDYAWPDRRIALEVEGGLWIQGRHSRGKGAVADLEKYSEAAIAGWRILYCTPKDLGTLGLDRVARALGESCGSRES